MLQTRRIRSQPEPNPSGSPSLLSLSLSTFFSFPSLSLSLSLSLCRVLLLLLLLSCSCFLFDVPMISAAGSGSGSGSGSCTTLASWNKCARVLNYTVAIDSNTCQQDIDALFSTFGYSSLSPSCRVAVSRVQCGQLYPPCSSPFTLLPASACQDVTTSCTSLTDRALVEGLNITQPWTCMGAPNNNISDTATAAAATAAYQFVSRNSTVPVYPTCFTLPSSHFCFAYISTPVQLPYNTTMTSQQRMIDGAQQADVILGGEPCRSLYYQTVCRRAYPPCQNITFQAITRAPNNTKGGNNNSNNNSNNTNNNNTLVPVLVNVTLSYPALPCLSLCRRMLLSCPPLLSSFIACDGYDTLSSCKGNTLVSSDSYPDPSIPFPSHAPLINASSTSNPKALAIVPTICSDSPPTPTNPPPISCIPLPSFSVCAGVLSYPVMSDTCFTLTESIIDTRAWVALSPSCRVAVAQYTCTQNYFRCSGEPGFITTTSVKPLAHVCIILNDCLQGNTTDAQVLQQLMGMDSNKLSCQADPDLNTTTTNNNNNNNNNNNPSTSTTIASTSTSPSPSPNNMSLLYLSPSLPRFSRCEAYTGSICRGIIGSPIFASAFPTPMEVEAMMAPLSTVLPLVPRAFGCRDNVMRLLCANSFPACVTTAVRQQYNVDADIPQPVFAAQAACQAAHDSCSAAQQSCLAEGGDITSCPNWLNTLQLNCSGEIVIGGGCAPVFGTLPQFPNQIQVMPGFGLNATYITYPPNQANQNIDGFVMSCPEPLITPDNWNSPFILSGGSCATPCTTMLWSPAAWTRSLNWFQGVGLTSFILVTFLNIAWLLPTARNDSRKWTPLHCFVISSFFVALSLVIGWFTKLKPLPGLDPRAMVICKSNSEPWTQADGGFCVAQAALFNLTIPWMTLYLNGMTMDAVCVTLFDSHKWPKIYNQLRHCFYHFLAIVFGIAFVLSQSDGNLASNGITPFCVGNPGSGHAWFFIISFDHIFPGTTTIGLCLVVAIIFRSGYRSGSTHKAWRKFIKLFTTYSRLFMMIIAYVTILVYTNVLNINSHIYRDKWAKATQDWITCILQSGQLNAIEAGTCPRPVTFTEGDWIAGLGVMTCIIGGAVTVVYISRNDFIAYHDFFILGLNKMGVSRFTPMGYKASTTDRDKDKDKDGTGIGTGTGTGSGQQSGSGAIGTGSAQRGNTKQQPRKSKHVQSRPTTSIPPPLSPHSLYEPESEQYVSAVPLTGIGPNKSDVSDLSPRLDSARELPSPSNGLELQGELEFEATAYTERELNRPESKAGSGSGSPSRSHQTFTYTYTPHIGEDTATTTSTRMSRITITQPTPAPPPARPSAISTSQVRSIIPPPIPNKPRAANQI